MGSDWQNKLYFGDNLEILRDHVGEESVDLIYLDPPFNSKATYSVLFKEQNGTASAAQVQILTIAELLGGAKLDYPRIDVATFKKAPRRRKGKRQATERSEGDGSP